ncbi:MAG: iron-sulfur cluster assembly scaffold protein, partial [Dehalococcoidia bacterium]|nr:iron-sulfur cluster assembly scaffold protein [Dehalococcoidia bacterium]
GSIADAAFKTDGCGNAIASCRMCPGGRER